MSERPCKPRRFPVRHRGPNRLCLGRRPAPPAARAALELAPLPRTEMHAWSRGLWGRFLPDRRRRPRPEPPSDAAA